MTFDPTQPPAGQPRPDQGAPAPAPQRPMVPSFIPPSVAAAAINPKPRTKVSAGTLGFVLAIVVAAAGLGFAGGRLTAPAAATTRGGFGANGGNFGGNGANGPTASGGAGRNGGLGGFNTGNVSLSGQVTAIADGSITVQTAGGQNVTVSVPSTVTYHAQAGAAATDVKVGSSVQLTVSRPTFRGADASGAPIASQQTTTGGAGLQLSATDILVLSK
jgi:hypothetical protein